jgi:hypothetical protein
MTRYSKHELEGLETIARLVAQVYEGRDWHKLSYKEQRLVTELRKQGFVASKQIPDGYVGRATL